MAQLLKLFQAKFTPRSVAGLVLWLDAQDKSSIALSGSNVSQWNDKSGKSNHAAQGTGANQPAYAATGVNALPCISFGAGKSLVVTDHASLDHTTLDIFAVLQRDTDSGGGQVAVTKYGGASISREFQIVVTSADKWQLQGSTTGAATDINATSATSATTGQAFVIEAGHNGSYGFVSVNGGAPALGSGSSGIVNSDGDITLGRSSGADFLGNIAELAVFSRYLGVAERAEMLAYLKMKWRVA